MAGKHARKRGLRHLWRRLWGEPSLRGVSQATQDWEPYMLTSRKFRQMIFVDVSILIYALIVVCVFDVHESALGEKALDVLQVVTLSYFGSNVLQKGIETVGKVKGMKPEPSSEAAESEEI